MVREPDDDPWARPRHEEPTSTPRARRRQPDAPGPPVPVEPSATLDTHEELEGGDETPLTEHLLRPGVLGAVLLLAGAAGLVLLLVHPWAPPCAARRRCRRIRRASPWPWTSTSAAPRRASCARSRGARVVSGTTCCGSPAPPPPDVAPPAGRAPSRRRRGAMGVGWTPASLDRSAGGRSVAQGGWDSGRRPWPASRQAGRRPGVARRR